MLKGLLQLVRENWHPLERLRSWNVFRQLQKQVDRTVFTRIPETDLEVAVRGLRDATWLTIPQDVEPEVREIFRRVIALIEPKVFWDVGANIGFYSWFTRRAAPVERVILFEPDPTNFSLLEETIARNGLTDCQALNVALSDENGDTDFMVDEASGTTGGLASTSHPEDEGTLQNAYALHRTIRCTVRRIDDLIAEGLPRPDLMKIDVEGAEHLVLAGAKNLLKRRPPTLIMETENRDLIKELERLGYTAVPIDRGNLVFLSPVLRADQMARWAGYSTEGSTRI